MKTAADKAETIKGQVLPYNKEYAILTDMTRPLRIESAGAVYHRTVKGNAQRMIFPGEKNFC